MEGLTCQVAKHLCYSRAATPTLALSTTGTGRLINLLMRSRAVVHGAPKRSRLDTLAYTDDFHTFQEGANRRPGGPVRLATALWTPSINRRLRSFVKPIRHIQTHLRRVELREAIFFGRDVVLNRLAVGTLGSLIAISHRVNP